MLESEPADANLQHGTDSSRRFLFDDADIRGEIVALDRSYRDILAIHQYAPGVGRLLGEFLAASVLLSTTLKFEGKLILQVRSSGQIPLLMAECNHELHIRGIARGAQEATALNNDQLLTDGQLAITIDPTQGQRYQGIVPLESDCLAHSLDAYFQQSEQLGTRFWLAADGRHARGLLLQQLPADVTPDAAQRDEQWNHACALASTVSDEELLQVDLVSLLHRLYHQDSVRLFDPRDVAFRCNCSRQRTRNALATLDPAEVGELLQELGVIAMDCEFCNQQYRFDESDLADVLGDAGSKTLH